MAVVAAGDIILGSGREPCLISCGVPAYGIIITGSGALTIFSKQF